MNDHCNGLPMSYDSTTIQGLGSGPVSFHENILPMSSRPTLSFTGSMVGEQQATAIEANLARLESKLDALLASMEAGSDAAQQDGVKDSSNKRQPPEKK
ncbi:hypothetical protein F5B18DRAFT_646502 [Nemania serpens]|nr:hypothetical protein F5B18DRAFT_646502 [Nemania serpens]